MDQKPIRWGMLGAGTIAPAFANDFASMKNARLDAVAASNPERLKTFQQSFQIPRALKYDELYTDPEIDAVYISTTHNFHFEQAKQCLLAGKAVLCEKPLVVNLKECDELIACARDNHVFLMEGMWTWFLPALKKVKQWVDEGRIGRIKMIQADFAYPMEKYMEGRMYNPALAGGSLLDLGIYPVAFAFYLMGTPPLSIKASGKRTQTGVDEQAGILFEYAEATAVLSSSIATRMNNTGKIFGETGHIEIPDFWRSYKATLYNEAFEIIETFWDNRLSHGFIYEMQHVNDLLIVGKKESDVMPLSASREIQRQLQEIRHQIGVVYPMD